jgi:hypothetical protein
MPISIRNGKSFIGSIKPLINFRQAIKKGSKSHIDACFNIPTGNYINIIRSIPSIWQGRGPASSLNLRWAEEAPRGDVSGGLQHLALGV